MKATITFYSKIYHLLEFLIHNHQKNMSLPSIILAIAETDVSGYMNFVCIFVCQICTFIFCNLRKDYWKIFESNSDSILLKWEQHGTEVQVVAFLPFCKIIHV